MTLTIDGRTLGALAVREGLATFAPPQRDELLAALRRDSDIALGAGERRWMLSDSGASAVMLKMDEFQGRLDTPGALVRKGQRDEAQVPSPKPAPRVRRVALPEPTPEERKLATDPAFVRAINKAMTRDDCEGFTAGSEEAPLTVRRLDGNRRLASALCWRAAYNEGYGFWIVDARPPHAATVVTILGWEELDNGQVTGAHKGRGLGDCWSHDAWTWNGKAFIHTASHTTGLCKLVAPGGAWELPTIVTDVVP